MEYNLRKVQLLQLEIAKEVKRICDKYQIKYFLIAGTLIGAVRHKGFIPWDDDLDIGILRDEYDRFLEIAKEEIDDRFFIQNWESDKNYAFPFTKIMLKGTKFVEKNMKDVDIQKGIFVDIFPYDAAPINGNLPEVDRRGFNFALTLLLDKNGYNIDNVVSNNFKKLVSNVLKHFFSQASLQRKIKTIMLKYNHNSEVTKVINYAGSYSFEKECLDLDWLKDTTELEFEGIKFACPKKYHEVLTHVYGNYMELPPLDKRGDRHQIKDVDLGKYA